MRREIKKKKKRNTNRIKNEDEKGKESQKKDEISN
jgi:hypothetical protein